MYCLFVITIFALSIKTESVAIDNGAQYIYEHLPDQSNPYIRNSNEYYEKYKIKIGGDGNIRNYGIRGYEQIDQSNQYPDIHKKNGNVLKPKPLKPGPWVQMSRGRIWPEPKYQHTNSTFLVLDVSKFRISVR